LASLFILSYAHLTGGVLGTGADIAELQWKCID